MNDKTATAVEGRSLHGGHSRHLLSEWILLPAYVVTV